MHTNLVVLQVSVVFRFLTDLELVKISIGNFAEKQYILLSPCRVCDSSLIDIDGDVSLMAVCAVGVRDTGDKIC